MPNTSTEADGFRVTLDALIVENGIDDRENPLLEEIGSSERGESLPVRSASVEFLRTVLAMQAEGQTVWSIRSRAAVAGTKSVISAWRKTLRNGAVGWADVLILDTAIADGPFCVDGHHRIVAAILENKSLRYVDLADLGA